MAFDTVTDRHQVLNFNQIWGSPAWSDGTSGISNVEQGALFGLWTPVVPVGANLTVSWDVRAVASDTYPTSWHVRTTVGDTYSTSWNVQAAVGGAYTTIWHVESNTPHRNPGELVGRLNDKVGTYTDRRELNEAARQYAIIVRAVAAGTVSEREALYVFNQANGTNYVDWWAVLDALELVGNYG